MFTMPMEDKKPFIIKNPFTVDDRATWVAMLSTAMVLT